MNEMYTMSIDIHDFGVIFLLLVVLFNFVLLKQADDIHAYARKMRKMMPMAGTMIALIIFTGAVMMAAKHLSFTVENILMIIFSVALIVMEAKRYARFKHHDITDPDAFERYRALATRLLTIELLLIVPISAWMLLS